MLDLLVQNAFDFLRKAKSEIVTAPKFSIISFHTAVELLLKARLMHEHWSLVVSPRQEPDWKKFVAGDFQSVSLKNAAERLNNVIGIGLSNKEMKSFTEISRHRNKAVHFFHIDHSKEDNTEQVNLIVKEQLTAWFFLHNLLVNKWQSVFDRWKAEINELDRELKSIHTYLQVVFDQNQAEIQKVIQAGKIVKKCPSCNFEANVHSPLNDKPYDSACLICGLTQRVLRISCPTCNEEVEFVNEGFGSCDSCSTTFDPKTVAGLLIDEGGAYISAKEGDYNAYEGNCSDCDGYHTVVRTEDDSWICAGCLIMVDKINFCGWCNEANTGDMEMSFISGCNYCDGRGGWERE